MWQFFLGFSTGIYVGTYYNCKPCLEKISKWVENHIPRKKD